MNHRKERRRERKTPADGEIEERPVVPRPDVSAMVFAADRWVLLATAAPALQHVYIIFTDVKKKGEEKRGIIGRRSLKSR